jgi:hypothetical protein
MDTVLETPREIPVLGEADIVVAGGGPSGWAAAVAAARMGRDVLLIESSSYLGGNLNLPGLTLLAALDWSGRPIIAGVMQDLIDRLVSMGGATGHFPCPKHLSMCSLDPEIVRFTLLEMAHEAGVRILLYTVVSDVVRDNRRLSAIIAEGKNGRFAIRGRVFIDANGDADLTTRAGARFEKGSSADGQLQPMTLTFRLGNCNVDALITHLEHHPEDLNAFNQPPREFPVEHLRKYPYWTITGLAGLAAKAKERGDFPIDLGYVNIATLPRDGQVGINAARVFRLDGTNVWDLTRGELEGRRKALLMTRFFQHFVPGFENSVLLDMAPRIGVRETRRIVGLATLTEQDIRTHRVFPDAIAQGIYPIDIHSQDATPSTFILLEEPYTIPYRALVPADLDNVIVAGRAISADRVAFGSLRVMSHCMAIGHAAGVAAAIALQNLDNFAENDITSIQAALIDQGALIGLLPERLRKG